MGDSLRAFVSPQGLLVNPVFRAYLVSQVLWVPKVSQEPGVVPKFAVSRMDYRGPSTEISDSPKPLPKACAWMMGPGKVPPQDSPWGSELEPWWI